MLELSAIQLGICNFFLSRIFIFLFPKTNKQKKNFKKRAINTGLKDSTVGRFNPTNAMRCGPKTKPNQTKSSKRNNLIQIYSRKPRVTFIPKVCFASDTFVFIFLYISYDRKKIQYKKDGTPIPKAESKSDTNNHYSI